MANLVKSQSGLSPSLAASLRELVSRADGRVEADATGSVNAQLIALWRVGKDTAVTRTQKLEELGLITLVRTRQGIQQLAVADGALAQVEAFERDRAKAKAKASRQNADLTARLRRACEIGRPRAALKL